MKPTMFPRRIAGALFVASVLALGLSAPAFAAAGDPEFSPTVLDFGDVQVGTTSAPQQLTINDPTGAWGNLTLGLNVVNSTGDPNVWFFDWDSEVCDTGFVNCTYNVTFAPNTAESHSIELSFVDVNTGTQVGTSTVTLTGNGIGDVPPPVVPEVPFTGMLAASGIGMFALGFVVLRRRARAATVEMD